MDNDDRQVGRILSRREVLALFGAAGAALVAGCAAGASDTSPPTSTTTQTATTASTQAATRTPTSGATAMATTESAQAATTATAMPACVVTPELTEGPYFVDELLNRSDIRSDPTSGSVREGVPLQLVLRVSQVSSAGCTALQGAMVDVWHCDALSLYSDVSGPGLNTTGQKFLRGYQVTDENGTVQFTTIYPGWYQGRAVHIHFKVRSASGSDQQYEFTSQFFFDDALTDQVHGQQPYASKGQRTLRNEGDNIYQDSGGQLTLDVTPAAEGYTTTFDIGVRIA